MNKIVLIFLIIVTLSCRTSNSDDSRFIFGGDEISGMEISGITSLEDGREILYITSVRFFSNWDSGWTEGYFEASGKYYVEPTAGGYKLIEIDSFELWDITAGEIRYHDVYYRKDDGLWKVKNRVDRLKELSRVFHKEMNTPDYLESPAEELVGECIKSSFPESLWELRDSGTFARDILEAPEIFNSLYNLEYFFNNIVGEEIKL